MKRANLIYLTLVAAAVVILFILAAGPFSSAIAQETEPTPPPDAPELIDARDVGVDINPSLIQQEAEPEVPDEIISPSAAGTAFTYQGRLTDGGAPANGAHDFAFSLFTASTGGSQVGGTVLKHDVSVVDGFFTLTLDFGSSAFSGNTRYLEIEVRPGSSAGSYTKLVPRQELTPSPYAINADTIDGKHLSDLDGRYWKKRIRTQVTRTLEPGESETLFVWGISLDSVKLWQAWPTTVDGRVKVTAVSIKRSEDTFTHFITIQNIGDVTTQYELKNINLE